MENRLFSPTFVSVAAFIAVVGAALVGAACGSNTNAPDAGTTQGNARLVILNDSDILGLAFGERRSLRVRYETDEGEPISGAVLAFSLVAADIERTGGAGLSATSSETDELGVARVDLVAGAENVSFRVGVSAPNALSATFYIAVSDIGFAHLVITPIHSGWRAPDDVFDRVEVRLYRAASVVCADVDIDAPPESLFPPRTMAAFGTSVSYKNISAREAYTVVSWATGADSDVRLSYGCVDLGVAQVPPVRVTFEVVVADRDLYLPATTTLSSLIDLQPMAAAVDASGANRPWRTLACQAGPGQLLLDCALDVISDDGVLDCVVTADHALVTAAEASRGAPDAVGCRPAVYGNMAATLDRQLTEAVVAGDSWPVDSALDDILSTRTAIGQGFELHSRLTLWDSVARHELTSVRIAAVGDTYTIDFADTVFPVVAQSQVALDTSDPQQLVLGAHGFTLRYGWLAKWAFADMSLDSEGLDGATLGTSLAGSVYDGDSGTQGCAALSALACTEMGEPPTCLETACDQAALVLDTAFTYWWQMMNGPGLDVGFAGSAPVYDFDNDLIVDSIGADDQGARTGAWQVSFATAAGPAIETTGTFGTASVIE